MCIRLEKQGQEGCVTADPQQSRTQKSNYSPRGLGTTQNNTVIGGADRMNACLGDWQGFVFEAALSSWGGQQAMGQRGGGTLPDTEEAGQVGCVLNLMAGHVH